MLAAERDARDAVAGAAKEGAALGEEARARARALAERTERRIRAIRAAFEACAAAEVAAIDHECAAEDTDRPLSAQELERLGRALAALAADLTDGAQ